MIEIYKILSEVFYDMSTVQNLNEVIQNISLFSGHGMKSEVRIPVDMPTKPFVFNNRYVIDLSKHFPHGFHFHYISILTFVRPNMTIRIGFVDKVKLSDLYKKTSYCDI